MRSQTLFLFVSLMLTGCARDVRPTEHVLSFGEVAPLRVAGEVSFTNAHTSPERVLVYRPLPWPRVGWWYVNLGDVAEVMVQQATKVIRQNLHATVEGPLKTIGLKVNPFSEEGTTSGNNGLHFQAVLGYGDTVDLFAPCDLGSTARRRTPGPGVKADLDRCIDAGVVALFQNGRVKAYLASVRRQEGEARDPGDAANETNGIP